MPEKSCKYLELFLKILLATLFNFKKTSEEQILDKIIDSLPKDNDEYYVNHKKRKNVFTVRKDYNQCKKLNLYTVILNLEKKFIRA